MADRKKVLTQLAGIGIGLDMAGYHDDAQCVRDALAMLREPARGWISVKERLPQHDDRVPLLYRFADSELRDGKLHTSMLRYVREPFCNDEPPHWERIGRYEYEVLYWFELPEQPEEAKE